MKFKICSYTTSGRNLYELHETEVEGSTQDVKRSVRMLEVLGHKVTGWIEEGKEGGQARERRDRR
jgi:hypothetical protein